MDARKIAVIGGTGQQGRALARWLLTAGHSVVIGSRSLERANAAAKALRDRTGGNVSGAANETAATRADVVFVVVPWDGHRELVESLAGALAGKVVVSCVNPLKFDAKGSFGLAVEEGSAAEQTQALVPGARMVGAFHHLSAVNLWESEDLLDENVLVCGDDADAQAIVLDLAAAVTGRPGIDVGALRLAGHLEPLTAVLIGINRRYKVRSGLAIVGVAS